MSKPQAHLRPEPVEGRLHTLVPWFDKLTTGSAQAASEAISAEEHFNDQAHSQGRFPGGRPRHAFPARHQGHAQGNADRRRPPRDPARGRRGARGRHRALHLRHRPQQGRYRGPLRQPVRAGAHARRARQEGGARPADRASCPSAGQTSFTRQQAPLGLGHAVWCAREIVGDEPFALLLPDVLHHAEQPCIGEMIEAYEPNPGNYIAVAPVPDDQTHQYGIVGVEDAKAKVSRITQMVEKPQARHGALQSAHLRPLHPAARDLRHPGEGRARRRRRDPDHRRHDPARPAATVLRRALRRHHLRLRLQARLPHRQRRLCSGPPRPRPRPQSRDRQARVGPSTAAFPEAALPRRYPGSFPPEHFKSVGRIRGRVEGPRIARERASGNAKWR